MPKLSYAVLLKFASKNPETKDQKHATQSVETETDDFDKVTDWLIVHYLKQSEKDKQKIAGKLLDNFDIDINQPDEELFKEELKLVLLIHLLENEPDANRIIDWIVKYDSPQHNGFGNLTLAALTNPHNFSFNGILRLVKSIAEPEKQLAIIKQLKELSFNAPVDFDDDAAFKQNKQDFFAELARLYAQAAISREAKTGALQPDWDATVALKLEDKKYLHALELGQLSIDKLLRENKNGIEILFNIHQYLYQAHGDPLAANQRNPVFGQIQNKLVDFYKIDLPDLMRGKQPGYLKSYYEAIVEKRAQSSKEIKAPPAKDLTMGVLTNPKKHRHNNEEKSSIDDQKHTAKRRLIL